MKLTRILISVAITACLSLPLRASAQRNYSFNYINSENGLSSSNVKTILQDSYNFMWFGTKNGLNRYDGIFMHQLNCYDVEKKRGNNNIGALYEDLRHNIWVGTDRGIYLYDPHKDQFHFVDKQNNQGVGAEDWVQDIAGDKRGNVWALLPNQGVFRYYEQKVDYYNVTGKAGSKTDLPVGLCVKKNGDVYVTTSGGGLYRYNVNARRFINVRPRGIALDGMVVQSAEERYDGNLVIGTQNGLLLLYDVRENTTREIKFSANGSIYLRALRCFGDEIWIGTQNGLYIVNEKRGTEDYLKSDPMSQLGLSDNIIYYIYRDNNSDAWVGTMFGGINYLSRSGFSFEKYSLGSSDRSLSSKRIRGMAQAQDGMIWIGTEEAGVNILNPHTGKVSSADKIKPSHKISLIIKRFGQKIYAGFTRNGVDVVDADGAVTNECQALYGSENGVYAVLKDSKGQEWVGLDWGLCRRDALGGAFKPIDEIQSDWIFDIFESKDGTIWMASMGHGIWKYTPATGVYKNYPYDEEHSNGLRSNSVSSITEDRRGNIWFSTDRGGIARYNKKTDNFTSFGIPEGLPDDVAYDILEDASGYFWFGTNKGLVKFDPRNNEVVKVFTTHDGLLGNQFNYHAAIKANGYFYYGGIEGLIAFNPMLDGKPDSVPPVYFTQLKIFNKEVTVNSQDSPLTENIIFTKKIVLPYDQANFSLSVASPSYNAQGSAQYSYRLDPVDRNWIQMSSDNVISYANLAPGTYTLRVRVLNNGIESSRELIVEILPPWYRSVWAYIGYFVLTVLAVLCWFFWYRNHKESQLRERQRWFMINKEKELFENKVQFFTEIAHEIRTPLTLIDSPLEAIEEIGVKETQVKKYLDIMRQNTKRLLDLTGQLLDFQKIGSSRLTLKYESVDVTSLLTETVNRFEPSLALKNKELIRNIPDHPIIAAIDAEAITKILSNLLNNALKYSQHTVVVSLMSDDEKFIVKVTTDGVKITEAEAAKIFEPFYQMSNRSDGKSGVGIGLPLSRKLAGLHNGTLVLENSLDSDNTFVLTIPINKEGIQVNNELSISNEDYVMDEESNQSSDNKGFTLLFVEDNETMREFLSEQLSQSFAVETAVDGKDALEKLNGQHVDLIVSDIMMPNMNGFDLCRAVKEDINLSHIPVIFLTAKNDLESKITGLKCGAEAFIEKPFSIKFFRQQIKSLLENRRRERVAFSKKPFFKVDNMQMNKADEEFMNRVVKTIGDNISEENFSVESMADIFCMSRSSLLRKIKTLFNLSPVELIRLVKLKKAAELIQEGKYRIGDICFMVGINSPSYFSKLFFKQFGISPKDFEKQCQKSTQIILTTKDSVEPMAENAD